MASTVDLRNKVTLKQSPQVSLDKSGSVFNRIRANPSKVASDKVARDKAEADAADKAAKDAQLSDAEKGLQQRYGGIKEQANELSLGKFGLADEDFDKTAALRQQIFEQQRGQLIGQQGAQSRGIDEALQRRLAAGGLKGTGAAEKLAQVSQKELVGLQGQQLGQLQLTQSQQELQSLEKEQDAQVRASQLIEMTKLDAERTYSQLVEGGMEAERARIFATDAAEKDRAFKEEVLLPFQESQFAKQMEATMEQLRQSGKQLDLDTNIANFNKKIASVEEPGILSSIMNDVGVLGIAGGVVGGIATAGSPWGVAAGAAIGTFVNDLFG